MQTSGTRYSGFRLEDKSMMFTKDMIELIQQLNPVSVLFDESSGLIRFKKGGGIKVPKDGRYQVNLDTLRMPRGRYYLKDIQDEWIDFTCHPY